VVGGGGEGRSEDGEYCRRRSGWGGLECCVGVVSFSSVRCSVVLLGRVLRGEGDSK